MIQKCNFCEDHDLQIHVPQLHTDIAKAIASGGVVNGSVTADFNFMDIAQAENGTRLREPFDALDYGFDLNTAQTSFSSGTGNNLSPLPSTQNE